MLVLRKKCTKDFLQYACDNCPLPCEIEYLYDNAGNSLRPEEMVPKLKGSEIYYVIVPRVDRRPRDELEVMRYYGQTMFMLTIE